MYLITSFLSLHLGELLDILLLFNIVSVFFSGLNQLKQDNWRTQAYYYAKGTSRNVLSHIRQWMFFTVFFGLCSLPASTEGLILFAELMSLTSGYDHIKAVIGSIGFLHQIFDLPFERESFQLRLTLQSLKRKLSRAPLQALPITIQHLKEMYRYVNLNNPEDLAIWCSILVGFFGLLRKKNLVPEDLLDMDPTKILTVGNFVLDRDRGIALVYIPFSKTNQFGQRNLVIPLVKNQCRALDPIYHLDLLFSRTEASHDFPAFSYKVGDRIRFVNYKSFTTKLKNLLSKAGFSPERFSGHSLRRGGATFLHACGGSILQIQACGDWQSSTWTKYIFISLEQRLLSQQLMSSNIPPDL